MSGLSLFLELWDTQSIATLHYYAALGLVLYLVLHSAVYFVQYGITVFKRIFIPAKNQLKPTLALTLLLGVLFILANNILLPNNYSTLKVKQIDISDMIKVDGNPDEFAWEHAEAVTISTHGGANFVNGQTDITVKALSNGQEMYFNIQWQDPTKSLQHLPLVKTKSGWKVQQQGFYHADEREFYEDKLAVLLSNSCGIGADGSDSTYGEMHTLIKFDTSSLPTCAIINTATVEVDVFNPTSGSYNLYASNNSWTESNATWSSVSGNSNKGTQVGSFSPGSTGIKSINLSSQGVSLINSWVSGTNNGIVIASGGTSNGIDMNSKEQGSGPVLKLTYEIDENCSSEPEPEPTPGGSWNETNLSGSEGNWNSGFNLDIPAGMSSLTVTMNGGSGDGDLYVNQGSMPTLNNYDCRPYKWGNSEVCTFDNPQAGNWYINIHAYSNYSGVSLNAEWE